MLNIIKQFMKYRVAALLTRRLGWMFTAPMIALMGYRWLRSRRT